MSKTGLYTGSEYRMGLDIVELVMDLGNAFGVSFQDAAPAHELTVGTLFDLVARQSPTNLPDAEPGRYTGAAWERFLDVVAQSTAVPREQLRAEARFADDLGLR